MEIKSGEWQPDWLEMNYVSFRPDVESALDSYYKRERLFQDGHTMNGCPLSPQDFRQLVIDSTKKALHTQGWACLASRHESVTGKALWIRNAKGHGIEVFESES